MRGRASTSATSCRRGSLVTSVKRAARNEDTICAGPLVWLNTPETQTLLSMTARTLLLADFRDGLRYFAFDLIIRQFGEAGAPLLDQFSEPLPHRFPRAI